MVTLVGEPASSPLDLAGPALIHGLGDLGDGMLVASLWDVAPDGSSDRIATATCLTGSRDVLALGDLGTRLRPGHRLELDLSASRAPAYPVHPGPGRDPWDGEAGPPSTHRLRTGGERGPRLELTTSPAARDGDG